jgi:thiol-disulfide isomerase/thioredoxin
MRKHINTLIVVVLACMFVGCSGMKVGSNAPAYTTTDAEGGAVVSSAYDGRVVLYYFWATWCAPCVTSSPEIDHLARLYRYDDRVEILAVHYDDKGRPLNYKAQHGYVFDVIPDGTSIVKAFGVDKIPAVIVVGKDGSIIHTQTAYSRGDREALNVIIQQDLDQ